jgi:hypothetical protein
MPTSFVGRYAVSLYVEGYEGINQARTKALRPTFETGRLRRGSNVLIALVQCISLANIPEGHESCRGLSFGNSPAALEPGMPHQLRATIRRESNSEAAWEYALKYLFNLYGRTYH